MVGGEKYFMEASVAPHNTAVARIRAADTRSTPPPALSGMS